jgi:hypothetical protein
MALPKGRPPWMSHLAGSRDVRPVPARHHPLGELEIAYLSELGAGRLDDLATRVRLWKSWGMCQRHALGFLAVEASTEDGWLFQAAVLYAEIMERAEHALARHWFLERARAEVNLEGDACPLCALGLTPDAAAPRDAARRVADGARLEVLQAMASTTRVHWSAWVCGACTGSGSGVRCRPHLAEELRVGLPVDLAGHRAWVREIARRVDAYRASFGWFQRGSGTLADEAALIGAMGWCSGWGAILEWLMP